MKKSIEIIIKHNSKKIKIKNVKKLSEFEKGIGLMFHSREKCPAMLFEFKKPTRMRIHSLFVFFKFAAIWTDDKNKIIEMKIVRPFRLSVSPKKNFYKLIEIPLNSEYKKEIKALFKNSL
jgi:uncharacterized membrane protein (UPF0127 family)